MQDNKRTALVVAIIERRQDIAEFLINNKANVSKTDEVMAIAYYY